MTDGHAESQVTRSLRSLCRRGREEWYVLPFIQVAFLSLKARPSFLLFSGKKTTRTPLQMPRPLVPGSSSIAGVIWGGRRMNQHLSLSPPPPSPPPPHPQAHSVPCCSEASQPPASGRAVPISQGRLAEEEFAVEMFGCRKGCWAEG